MDRQTDLDRLIEATCYTPRAAFPPSRPINKWVASVGEGLYLLTKPFIDGGDVVWGIGWANGDAWAERVWGHYKGPMDVAAPVTQSRPPSLGFLGRPEELTYGRLVDFEGRQPGASPVDLVGASYRGPDGVFLWVFLRGGGPTYFFASTAPAPTDVPVAIEFNLREGRSRQDEKPPRGIR